jgi:hypothetical protein
MVGLKRQRITRYLTSLAAGIAFSLAFAKHFTNNALNAPWLSWLLLAVLAGIFSVLSHLLLFRIIAPRIEPFPPRARLSWLAFSAGVGAFLMLAIPIQLHPDPTFHHLTIKATGQKNSASKSTEVWVIGLYSADGTHIPVSAFRIEGDWEIRDDVLVSYKSQPAVLEWDGPLPGDGTLVLAAHPWSGIAEIWVDGGRARLLDLYAPNGDAGGNRRAVTLQGDKGSAALLTPQTKLFIDYAADAVSISLLFFLASVLLGTLPVRTRDSYTPGRWSWLWYTVPCAAVWAVYLLAFWPGFISADSLNQWGQVLRGEFYNEHPAFHTLTNWLITRVWLSPASVAIVQICFLSVLFGLAMRELACWRVPVWVRITVTALFALSIVNGMMVITLWKDIAFAIAMLGLFIVLLRLVRTGGTWIDSWQGTGSLWLALVCTSLYRHNGVLIPLLTLPLLMWVWRKRYFVRFALVGAIWIVTYFIVIGPLYGLIRVHPMAPFFAMQTQIHQIGAVVNAGVPLTEEQQTFLSQIEPLDYWKTRYDCYSLNTLVYNDKVNYGFIADHSDQLAQVWWQLVTRYPGVMLQHFSCVTAMVWEVNQPTGRYYSTAWPYVSENDLGLRMESKWPAMQTFLTDLFNNSEKPENVTLFWRPALYLYISLFCIFVTAVRLRRADIFLVAMPAVSNSIALLALITVQDFRFQYGVYVLAFLSVGLTFSSLPTSTVNIPSVNRYYALLETETVPPSPSGSPTRAVSHSEKVRGLQS